MTEQAALFGFDDLADRLGTPLFLVSKEGLLLGANQAAAFLMGRTNGQGDFIGQPLAAVCSRPEQAENLVRRWARTSQRTPGLLTLLRPDGEEVECRCSGSVISRQGEEARFLVVECQPKNRHPSQFVALNQKIEELRKELIAQRHLEEERAELLLLEQAARLEAEEASLMKDQFLGMVSHELRTPITTIYGNAVLLRSARGKLSEDDEATALEDVQEEASRLRRIIENLLVLARADTMTNPDKRIASAQEQVRQAASTFTRSQPSRQLMLSLDETVPPLLAVPEYVEMLLSNLLSNADKYSPPGKPIEVRLRRENEAAVISVLDEGAGIPPGEEELIFAPFFRSARVRDAIGGVGLGLSVCRRLVEVQGGTIWAVSRSEGGTEMSFTLPLHIPAQITTNTKDSSGASATVR